MMQVRNKIGVKILNLTPTPENFDFVTPTPIPPKSKSGFGVQCRALPTKLIEITHRQSLIAYSGYSRYDLMDYRNHPQIKPKSRKKKDPGSSGSFRSYWILNVIHSTSPKFIKSYQNSLIYIYTHANLSKHIAFQGKLIWILIKANIL